MPSSPREKIGKKKKDREKDTSQFTMEHVTRFNKYLKKKR